MGNWKHEQARNSGDQRPLVRRRTAWAIALVLTGLPACTDRSADIVDRSDSLLVATLEQTLGEASGGDTITFAIVRDVLLDAAGRTWVLDASDGTTGTRDPRLRVFAADGRVISEVGRQGRGPGEFSDPLGLALLPDGRVALRDRFGASEVLIYAPSGAFDSAWPTVGDVSWPSGLAMAYGVGAALPIQVDTAGTMWLPMLGRPMPRASGAREPPPFLRVARNGRALDVVRGPRLPEVDARTVRSETSLDGGGVSSVGVAIPLLPSATWTWSPRGFFAVARTDQYSVEQILPVGDQADTMSTSRRVAPSSLPTLTRRTAAVQVDDVERADLEAAFVRELAKKRVPRPIRLPAIPAVKPVIRSLMYADDGRLLVTVHAPSRRVGTAWEEPTQLDLFAVSGAYIGRMEFPAAFSPRRMYGQVILGTYVHEDGSQSIRRYRVTTR